VYLYRHGTKNIFLRQIEYVSTKPNTLTFNNLLKVFRYWIIERRNIKMKILLVITALILTVPLVLTSCAGRNEALGGSSEFSGKYDLQEIDSGIVNANTGFAFDIFKILNEEESGKNVFISPLSISTALAMTYNGARGSTKQAMADALGIGDADLSRVNTSFQNLIAYLNKVDKKVKLDINNSIWIRERENIQEEFLSNTGKYFNAFSEMLDFSKDESVQRINKWISDATRGKINKMLEPPISPDVMMYLINAIYFKGEWKQQFSEDRTYGGKFTSGNGTIQDIKMMSRKGKVEYAKGEDYKAVRLPYGSGKTSMYCILPDESINIDDFIFSMDAAKWNEVFTSPVETDDVTLGIPRFKMEYGIKLLNNSLISMGMGEAFSFNADFSGIREGIFISRVLHKAVIEVNEEGSEAAGVTVVEMKETSITEPLTFIADRPFLFIIADDKTGTILFIGKMSEAA
jgi:serine protease inhibitor